MCPAHSAFRVSSVNDSGRSHVLQANDELDKRHWLQCIDEALSREVLPITTAKQLLRHSSNASTSTTTGKFSSEFQSPTSSSTECSSAAGSEENVDEPCGAIGGAESLPPLALLTSGSLQVSKHIFEEL